MWNKRSKTSEKVVDGLVLLRRGEEIFSNSPFREQQQQLKLLVSCPPDTFAKLYLMTCHAFAETCQAMPAEATGAFAKPYGLLEKGLLRVKAALSIRRGRMLPKGAEAERIASEEALWTYCVFCSALLKDLSKIADDRSIELCTATGEHLGIWCPVMGPCYEEDTYYRLQWQPVFMANQAMEHKIQQSHNLSHQDLIESALSEAPSALIMTALVSRIVPSLAFRWLYENKKVYHFLWEVLLGLLRQDVSDNPIQQIIDCAEQKLGFYSQDQRSLQNNQPTSDQHELNSKQYTERNAQSSDSNDQQKEHPNDQDEMQKKSSESTSYHSLNFSSELPEMAQSHLLTDATIDE